MSNKAIKSNIIWIIVYVIVYYAIGSGAVALLMLGQAIVALGGVIYLKNKMRKASKPRARKCATHFIDRT